MSYRFRFFVFSSMGSFLSSLVFFFRHHLERTTENEFKKRRIKKRRGKKELRVPGEIAGGRRLLQWVCVPGPAFLPQRGARRLFLSLFQTHGGGDG